MGRRTALLIAAVVIAAAGAAMILVYVQGINARAVEGQERVAVLAASEVIDAGETMQAAQSAGKVRTIDVAKADMVPGALSSTDGITDLVAVGTIFPGEQIISQKFVEAGSQDSLAIPKDKIAISVDLTDPARVAGFVQPGSQVAIFASGEPALMDENGETTPLPPITRMLLPKVQVIGVGTSTVQPTTTTNADGEQTVEEIPRAILTIAVSQREAEKVIFMARNGELSFGLRTDRSKLVSGPAVTAENVFTEGNQ
ncbi:MAG TPA: Flp pilus assembly protein CpaB [Nocardioidaceae bacterium]|nr:Flp pilus assembly protein CpaB [Nocardioidaceae bacterium]